jgi:hypothetical protein
LGDLWRDLAARTDKELMAGGVQVHGHGRAHDTESDETDFEW